MMMKKSASKTSLVLLIGAVLFVAYNVLLFLIAGFEDHGPTFWVSYAFELLAAVLVAVTSVLLRSRVLPKDWIFGYPFWKHSLIYLICETVASILFMALDTADFSWKITLVVQILLLIAYAVMIVSCFLAKDTIEAVQQRAKVSTTNMRLLQVDAEMVAARAQDDRVKAAFAQLAEQIRFSDPMSNEALAPFEEQIASHIRWAGAAVNNPDEALRSCKQAASLLEERNKKCKILK